jgi:hypothetical protein
VKPSAVAVGVSNVGVNATSSVADGTVVVVVAGTVVVDATVVVVVVVDGTVVVDGDTHGSMTEGDKAKPPSNTSGAITIDSRPDD